MLGVDAGREQVRAFIAVPIGAVIAGSEHGAAALNATKGPSRLSYCTSKRLYRETDHTALTRGFANHKYGVLGLIWGYRWATVTTCGPL